ncbi:MAG: ATP-binding cassette domain-containing protein [Lachnospiraceae bacterium]|nr:ATP-binding cassette domain-containing protein [Ruminococcus sp.]MCM1276303.1 ATP-binding cassette domain-containing protein [Lachnospiraceae bacterium]
MANEKAFGGECRVLDFDLNFRYQDEKVSAVKGVSGRIERGKCIVLCGGSGCGKSTLLRCFNGLVPQFYGGELNGSCRIRGRDVEVISSAIQSAVYRLILDQAVDAMKSLACSDTLADALFRGGYNDDGDD